MASSMDGVMDNQLHGSCVGMSVPLQTTPPGDSASGLNTEMPGITETTTPKSHRKSQEMEHNQ